MSYTFTHIKDGRTIERKRVFIRSDPDRAEKMIHEGLQDRRKRLRDRKGWTDDKRMKLVASIPASVVEEVILNDGPEASRDLKYLIRRSEELGFRTRMKR